MYKGTSLLVSETFFKCLEQRYGENLKECYLQTFNNCREYGFVLINFDKNWVIWACECRNSDNIMLVFGTLGDKNLNNMFSEEAYNSRKYFEYQRYDLAVDSAIEFIEDMEE